MFAFTSVTPKLIRNNISMIEEGISNEGFELEEGNNAETECDRGNDIDNDNLISNESHNKNLNVDLEESEGKICNVGSVEEIAKANECLTFTEKCLNENIPDSDAENYSKTIEKNNDDGLESYIEVLVDEISTEKENGESNEKKRNKKFNNNTKLLHVDSRCLVRRERLKYMTMNTEFRRNVTQKIWRRTSSLRRVDDLEFGLQLFTTGRTSTPELARSQYSLVSCSELTPEAVQLWLELPEEVKYDSSLALFRRFYEKEHGKVENIQLNNSSDGRVKRLPLVNSAPHLNNNAVLLGNGQNGHIVNNLDAKKNAAADVKTIQNEGKESKMSKAKHYIKMTVLIAAWIFFTVVFMMYGEKEEIVRKSAVSPGEVKSYILNVNENKLSLQVDLSGPFLTEQEEKELNSTQKEKMDKMHLWLESWTKLNGNSTEQSKPWSIILQENGLDFNEGETRSTVLHLKTSSSLTDGTRVFAIRINTTADETVPFSMSYTKNPLDENMGVVYACVLLVVLYALIIFEIINRTLAAVLVATLSLAALALTGERPSLEELVSWLDMETLLLLFSMMILVAIMAETGLFDFLAVFTFQVTKGRMWPLVNLLCVITALLSTFLDNVTTVLLMTPVTIKLCEVTDMNPIPVLMAMVLYSNIGGTATPVGDPPNVIIASNKDVIQSNINFANFTLHMTIGILFVCVQTYLQLRYVMYRNPNKLRLGVPREIEDLRRQISVWRRACESLPHISKDESIVRDRLEKKVQKLTLQLEALRKERSSRAVPKETFENTLKELKEKYKIRDKVLLLKSSVAIGFVVAVFFLHALPEFHRVSLGWTALLGAILLLILADREELEPIMHRVEWSTLLFFAALFVLMEALSKLGLINYIGGLTESLIMSVNESARLAVAIMLILWVSGVTSAFVDNIPLTTMMVRVVTSLGSNPALNIPMAPLIWSLSFGACLGGNGTLIGASANVVCAGVAEQHGYRFTFVEFFKVGFPVMIGHLVVASAYLLLCHCVFTWH